MVGEFVGAQQGLGNPILQFNFGLDIAGVCAVPSLLSVMGVAPHLIMQAIQKRVIFLGGARASHRRVRTAARTPRGRNS
jgi:NitT/TauT family transport system permease protein